MDSFISMGEEREENNKQTAPNADNYDGWGFDLFPERRGAFKKTIKNVLFQGRGNENLERVKCERNVTYCLRKSTR